MMLPALIPVISVLAKEGLELLGNAVLTKGKDYIEEKTGVKLAPNMTSEDLRKLKEFELMNETELRKLRHADDRLELEFYQAEVKERESARNREVAIAQEATKQGKPWFIPSITDFLATIVVLGAGYVAAVTTSGDVRATAVGVLTLVLGYYFGQTHRRPPLPPTTPEHHS